MIALFRHLPTVDDIGQVYTGWDANPSLAPLSGKTISFIREEMLQFARRFDVQLIYVSDNPRGKVTISTLFPDALEPLKAKMDVRLNNIKQPEWSGKSQTEVAKSPLYYQWHTAPLSIRFANGESLMDVVHRVESLVKDIAGRPAILISHTTPMQVLLCTLLGINPERLWSFQFEHLAFTLIYKGVLLRYNSKRIADVELNDLRTVPHA